MMPRSLKLCMALASSLPFLCLLLGCPNTRPAGVGPDGGGTTQPVPVEGTLVVNPDVEDPLIALVEKDGEWLMLHGEKDANGDILDLHSVTYRASPDTATMTLTFDDDGMPSKLITQGWLFHFSNWRDDRVDCMIVNPAGDAAFVEDVAADPQYVAGLRALWDDGESPPLMVRLNRATAKPFDPFARHTWYHRSLGWVFRGASYAVDCVGGIAERALQGAVVVPVVGVVPGAVVGALTGCGSALLTAFADVTGNETLEDLATGLGLAQCVAVQYSSCLALATNVYADTFFEDHEDHQASEDIFETMTGNLAGVVRDAATRAPLAGARVRLLRGQQPASGGLTDADGRYVITAPAATDYRLEVSKDGYSPVTYFPVEVSALQTAEWETLLPVESGHDDDTDGGNGGDDGESDDDAPPPPPPPPPQPRTYGT